MAHNPDRASYFPAIETRYGQPMDYWFTQMRTMSDSSYKGQMAFLMEKHGFSRTHANALVLYCRGSVSAKRFATLDEYLETVDADQRRTLRDIFSALTQQFPDAEVVIAWNKPMLKHEGRYLFGAGASRNHILIAPFDSAIIEALRPRLGGYQLNKKTIRVPNDWQVDEQLLIDMVASQISQR